MAMNRESSSAIWVGVCQQHEYTHLTRALKLLLLLAGALFLMRMYMYRGSTLRKSGLILNVASTAITTTPGKATMYRGSTLRKSGLILNVASTAITTTPGKATMYRGSTLRKSG
eukprot:scpid102376/ scgid13071/ 